MSAPGIRDVVKNRPFRLLAFGVIMSRIGDAMTVVVMTWLALAEGGPRAVGLVLFAGGVVAPFSAPIIGYLIDMLGLRVVVLVDNVARALLTVTLALLVHLDMAGVPHFVVFMVLSTLFSPATELAQNVATPALLTSRELDAANRLLSASWDIAAWIGPAVAGFGIDSVGAPAVLLVDAATFMTMAMVARVMPGRRAHSDRGSADGRRDGVVRRILSGFVMLWHLRPVMILTLVTLGNLFLGGMMEVFLPAFTADTLGEGASAYGLLISIAGVTTLVGTLLLTPAVVRLGYGRGLVIVLFARGALVLPLAFIDTWALAAVVVALAGFPDGNFFPMARTMQQRLIPADVRGRVQGARATLGVAGFPLGTAAGGLLVAAIGPQAVAVVMAVGYVPLALAILFTPALMRHRAPAEVEEAATEHSAGEQQ